MRRRQACFRVEALEGRIAPSKVIYLPDPKYQEVSAPAEKGPPADAGQTRVALMSFSWSENQTGSATEGGGR